MSVRSVCNVLLCCVLSLCCLLCLCGSLLCLLCCVTVRRRCCVGLVDSPGIGHGPWRRTPALCQQMACYHDAASASHGLCRRCMVAVGICTASGMGGSSLSAVPCPAVPGQHPLLAQHFCPVAPLCCPGGTPSPGPALQPAPLPL